MRSDPVEQSVSHTTASKLSGSAAATAAGASAQLYTGYDADFIGGRFSKFLIKR